MEKYILIDKKKKITHQDGDETVFETEIYDNSGILNPKIAGFIRYIIFYDYVELKQIFVDPEVRRGGHGALLVKELEKATKKNGKKKIITHTGMIKGDVFGDFLIGMGFRITKPGKWEKRI